METYTLCVVTGNPLFIPAFNDTIGIPLQQRFTMENTGQFHQLTNFRLHQSLELQAVAYRENLIATQKKYEDPTCLNRFEYEIFSQSGEDGIIDEIFRRIGADNRYFVEFGAGNGLQNSTAALLLKNWVGLWMEADPGNGEIIRKKFASLLLKHRLSFLSSFITAENIEELFGQADVPESFDLLSIDLDGNDYWIWKTITHYSPRVVMCEYNPRYGSDLKWVMKYNPAHRWNGTCYYGASLKSLELLGREKGYKLVACNTAGVNAFFVRNDLVGAHFSPPFTSEFLYEPQRTFLIKSPLQRNDFGDFESI